MASGRRAAIRHAHRGAGGGEIEGDRGAEAPAAAGDEDLRVREIDHGGTLAPVTAPNWISVARILLVPVCVALLLAGGEDEIRLAAIVFAIAALTDFLDGYAARARNSSTTFGKFVDPLADKLLVTCVLIALGQMQRVRRGWR